MKIKFSDKFFKKLVNWLVNPLIAKTLKQLKTKFGTNQRPAFHICWVLLWKKKGNLTKTFKESNKFKVL